MGTRGPAPKRVEARMGHQTKAQKASVSKTRREEPVKVPRLPAGGAIHPVARRWFNALSASGQSEFFEPSDWQSAIVLTLKLSAHLSVDSFAIRLIVLAERLSQGNFVASELADELREMSLNTPRGTAAEFSAIWSAMESLLTTEASRRRSRIEVERGAIEATSGPTAADKFKLRLAN